MDFKPLPFNSTLEQYQKQAGDLLEAHRAGDGQAIRIIHEKHPRFLDSKIPWLPKNLPDSGPRPDDTVTLSYEGRFWIDSQNAELSRMTIEVPHPPPSVA